MLVTSGVCEKHQGDAAGDSILSGFRSSSGSSSDETCEQEELLDELARQMTEHMLRDDDEEMEKEAINEIKQKASMFAPSNVLQNQEGNKNKDWKQKDVKDYGDGGSRAGFVPTNGSGMKVIYLGESGSRSGSAAGTGVFIPNATPDHQLRRKQGRSSRVIIPERVLNSLKQHQEKRTASRATQAHPNALFHARPNQRSQQQETPNKTAVNAEDDDELQLPQEWTY